MKKLIKATAITLALSLSTLYAGSGHSHDNGHGHSHAQEKINKPSAEKISKQELMKLVKNKRIHKSWLDTSILATKKKKFYSKDEWLITYYNEDIKDKSRKTLYIFISEYGKVTGSNYTGN